MSDLKCFFCNSKADRLGYYSKFYGEFNRGTRENPTLFCESCWFMPGNRNQIHCHRGGMDGVYCLTFETIASMPKKKVAWQLSNKGFEINHMANKRWRKLLWHIFYSNQPKKRMIDDDPRERSQIQNGT